MVRRLATCSLLSLALWAGLALGAGAAQARVPAAFLGIYSDDLLDAAPSDRATALHDQANIGVGVLRYTFDWERIERSPGQYELAPYDALVADAAAHGI